MIYFFILGTTDIILQLIQNGDDSEIEGYDKDELEFKPSFLFQQTSGENFLYEGPDQDIVKISPPSPSPSLPEMQSSPPSNSRASSRSSRSSRRGKEASVERRVVRDRRRQSKPAPRSGGKRIWRQNSFEDKPHDYPTLPAKPVRRPIDYFRDYIDDDFLEMMSLCTNKHYFRETGRELKSTSAEIAKLLGLHVIMGCIPFPKLTMYWRSGTKLRLICDVMTRERFVILRNALHVVPSSSPDDNEKHNPLWKVQPMINKIKETCNKLERVAGFYCINEQIIPLYNRCNESQVDGSKPQPTGLRNFVMTTSEGLLLDFEIYTGTKTMDGDSGRGLGLGHSVILHLAKSIPPGSCVYQDRNFTTVPMIEEMEKLNLHATGTIAQNRIPDSVKFKTDAQMLRGEIQQVVCSPTVLIKWKDNKSMLLASNCTGAAVTTKVKRWDKTRKCFVNVRSPNVVQNYKQHKRGDVMLNKQLQCYRTSSIKTEKWTLKVLLYFLDLALVNSWRLYHNDCKSNGFLSKDIMSLLKFRMDVADTLTNTPDRTRRESDEDDFPQTARRTYKVYRPAIAPSEGKRYDGYEHYPSSDALKAPRSCRMENCGSRSRIKCEKCNVYLCLSRSKNCFISYHKK